MRSSPTNVALVAVVAVAVFLLGGGALLLSSASARVFDATEGACGVAPKMYRLDATYHHLPESFVQHLIAHEPKAPDYFDPKARCENFKDGNGASIDYCVCFGTLGCTHLQASNRCTGEIGLIPPWGRAGVCRADSAAELRDPCRIESVTIG
jgi:hypothetical protein